MLFHLHAAKFLYFKRELQWLDCQLVIFQMAVIGNANGLEVLGGGVEDRQMFQAIEFMVCLDTLIC